MKIVVFSDTHGAIDGMLRVISKEKPNYLFHLGDHYKDIEEIQVNYPTLPIANVKGNCDWGNGAPEKREFSLGGKKFFLTHGHLFHVKNNISSLYLYGKLSEADVVVFGHTHIPLLQKEEGIYLLNPGSMGFSNSYATIEIDESKTNIQLKNE